MRCACGQDYDCCSVADSIHRSPRVEFACNCCHHFYGWNDPRNFLRARRLVQGAYPYDLL